MPSAYAAGLRMLARRELSEAQVRDGSSEGSEPAAIDDAVSGRRRRLDDYRRGRGGEDQAKRRGCLRIERHRHAGHAPRRRAGLEEFSPSTRARSSSAPCAQARPRPHRDAPTTPSKYLVRQDSSPP
jgi:hypothetical protein